MRLVTDFQPWNYMAQYHAGMSFYVTGDHELSRVHLRKFVEQYGIEDGWRANAHEILRRLGDER